MTAYSTPFLDILRAYGIDANNVPEDATIQHAESGITIDEFVTGEDGNTVSDIDPPGVPGRACTRRQHYPHPTGSAVLYTHAEVLDEYTEKITEYRADGQVVEQLYTNTRKRNSDRREVPASRPYVFGGRG